MNIEETLLKQRAEECRAHGCDLSVAPRIALELIDRIAALEQQLAEQRQINSAITEAAWKESIRAGDLEWENQWLRRDAERFEWIVENCLSEGGGRGFTVFVPVDHEDIGCGIDAARSKIPACTPSK